MKNEDGSKLPSKSVNWLTNCPAMTIAVNWDNKRNIKNRIKNMLKTSKR